MESKLYLVECGTPPNEDERLDKFSGMFVEWFVIAADILLIILVYLSCIKISRD